MVECESIEMWLILRASDVLLKACLRLSICLVGWRWRHPVVGLKLLTPAPLFHSVRTVPFAPLDVIDWGI
jgi:hypothetical protein